jgi:hypothetical protein
MSRPRFKTRRTKDPNQDPHWQDVQSLASWLHLRPVPNKRDPHDKSPTHTRSLHLARPHSGSGWYVGHDVRCEHKARAPPPTHVGGTIPHAMQVQQLAAMQAAHPDKSLNAGLTGCTAIPSPSSLALPHASSARGTQAPSTMRTGLDLGSSVEG